MTKGMTAKKMVRIVGIVMLFVVVVGYGIWGGKDLLFGIHFKSLNITDGMRAETSPIEIIGIAPRAKNITIDGGPISVGEDGSFHDTRALLPGYNSITISASDKFGQTITKNFQVYYPPPPEKSTPAIIETIEEEKPTTDQPTQESEKIINN